MAIAKIKTRKQGVGKIRSAEAKSKERQCYLLLALPLIGFFVFTLYPMLWSMSKAFYYYDQIPSNTKFVGLENFIDLFTNNKAYWQAWITTLQFTIYKLPFEMIMTLGLALLMSKKVKTAGLFRTVYFMPCVISVALSSVIFSNLFQYFGFFNDILLKIGLISSPIDWFATKGAAMTVLTIGGVWSAFGINVLYFSAALTNVPDELYEAAELDGVNAFQKFIYITIPMIAPVFQTILLLGINGTLQTGEYVLVMTNGAPGGTTNTVGSLMLSEFVPGFASGSVNVGYGCAMAIINSIIFGAVAVLFNKLSAKMQNIY